MWVRIVLAVGVLVVLGVAVLWVLGRGTFVEPWGAGEPTAATRPADTDAARTRVQTEAASLIGVGEPKQILFGDLHVHTTYSTDAFLMALPMLGGDGAYPVSDACDFARYCSALDFWSINDHAVTLTPERWAETVEEIRQCNAVASDRAEPDTLAFLGWEWTQMGTNHTNHWGHKNVVLRDLDEVPARPIAATPTGVIQGAGGAELSQTLGLGLVSLFQRSTGGPELARYIHDLVSSPPCENDRPVRELGTDCREFAATPRELFAKLDDWGFESLVIPHGTTWGFYSPLGSSWDKQLTPEQHDPERQRLVEMYSGHGNSEEYRSWREVEFRPDGSRACPESTASYQPGCRRAGELIRERCLADGESESECSEREAVAQQNFVDADASGWRTVPGTKPADWLDSSQCRDCFQPSFSYRPRSSAQYMLALGRPAGTPGPHRFRFGFIASSDNHSGRPGTGYKEYARTAMTEARFGNFTRSVMGQGAETGDPAPESVPFDHEASTLQIFALMETERNASFFLTGGLVAAHASARDRDSVWQALERREVYATSGPRLLLWFDLVRAGTGGTEGTRFPMGSEVELSGLPSFEVRAVGSFEQQPGCPAYASNALAPERLERLCRGECYHPSDRRRLISRIEIVRIRPQVEPDEDVTALVEDPWRSFPCEPDPSGCRVVFSDEEFPTERRDTVYYARAIEEPSLAVDANPLNCERDADGRCVSVSPCAERDASDDCLSETEQRAWSSPIFVDHVGAD